MRDTINESYKFFIKGDILRASTKMSNAFFHNSYYGKKLFDCFKKDFGNITLYRARKYNKDDALLKFLKSYAKNADENFNQNKLQETIKKSMFHVGFGLRSIVGNARFSLSGFPCLYLADSIECCSKEINQYEKNIICCSYKVTGSYKCFDLVNDYHIKTRDELVEFLLKYLVVQAISYSIKADPHNVDKFKDYYVISQLITSSIASYCMKKNGTVKNKVRQCIRYKSVKFSEEEPAYNYVFIPMVSDVRYINDDAYDDKLFEMFDVDVVKKI